jgi:hypothetical protein
MNLIWKAVNEPRHPQYFGKRSATTSELDYWNQSDFIIKFSLCYQAPLAYKEHSLRLELKAFPSCNVGAKYLTCTKVGLYGTFNMPYSKDIHWVRQAMYIPEPGQCHISCIHSGALRNISQHVQQLLHFWFLYKVWSVCGVQAAYLTKGR